MPDAYAPIVHEEHTAAVEHLSTLLDDDRIDLDLFEAATSRVLATTSTDELAVVLAALPPPVRMTPPERRLDQPLVLETRSGVIKLTSSWQLASETRVRCASGTVRLDLTVAEFDDDLIDLDLDCASGVIDVVVPHGVAVRMVEISGHSGTIKNHIDTTVVLPGMPCLVVSARTRSGTIKLRRPGTGRGPRWLRWLRRGR